MCNLFYDMSFKTWLKNGWYYVRFYTKVWFTNYFKREHNNSLEKRGYVVTFNDEFDQPINWDNWKSCEQWGCDRGTFISKQSQVTQSGSDVIFTTDMNDVANEPKLKSGGLFSWNFFNTKYGYFETREKLGPKGIKYWPAFWLTSSDSWPPEIDIFELMGDNSSYFTMTLHWRNTWTNAEQIQNVYNDIFTTYGYVATNYEDTLNYLKLPEWTQQKQNFIDQLESLTTKEMVGRRLKFCGKDFLSKGYHIYACEWSENKVTWFIDNLAVYEIDKHIPTRNMFLIINNGGSENEPNPSDYPMPIYCDYIRAYKKN